MVYFLRPNKKLMPQCDSGGQWGGGGAVSAGFNVFWVWRAQLVEQGGGI